MFIVGRAVQGLGGAGIMNGAFTIMAASVPSERKPRAYWLTFAKDQVRFNIQY